MNQDQINQLVALVNGFIVADAPAPVVPDPSKIFSQADLDAAVAAAQTQDAAVLASTLEALKAKVAADLAPVNADVASS